MLASKFAICLLVALTTTGAYATQAGLVNVRKLGDRSSCPVKPWTPTQTADREKVIPITFKHVFTSTPLVTATISALAEDTKIDSQVRIKVDPEDVTLEGFNLRVGTWCHTYINWVRVSWTAHPDIYGSGVDVDVLEA